MSSYYKNDRVLAIKGYEIYFTRFADSIMGDHFTDALSEIEGVLNGFYIDESQIIEGGGGLSTITQTLGNTLKMAGWIKENIVSEHHVRGKILTSESHEVDHYKSFKQGNVGLEIEWNNKDPFYDRDLENFRKLHQIGEMSVGIIVTRGESLQTELYYIFQRFLISIYPFTVAELTTYISLSFKARDRIDQLLKIPEHLAVAKIAREIYSSKYGTATTHMDKLLLRIMRGVGNPCPCVLIGIGKDRIKN